MTQYLLVPHPDFPSVAVTGIAVDIARRADALDLTYVVRGDLDRVVWPAAASARRTDQLWQHTCFEAFIRPVDQAGYTEINLSPSGRWASYTFEAHRAGMGDGLIEPHFRWEMPILVASLALSDIATADWSLGLTAVIEASDGSKSYWALAHAPGAPDFHNRDCFIATLPAPTRP